MLEPIFVRCVRCDTSFNYYHAKEHVCPAE